VSPQPASTTTGTTGKAEATQSGGRDPSRAIAAKKEQAAANRDKITAAITALQRGGHPVNVQSVARAAGVHPHTLRRNPDLLKEVQYLRENSSHHPPTTHAPATAASHNALKARLLTSQAEVADLRRDLAQLRRDAHQALGTAPARPDPSTVEDLHRDIAELRVQLMNERDTTRTLHATTAATTEDLTAAHEIARSYLRELNQTKDELQRTRRELVKLRTQTSTASLPSSPIGDRPERTLPSNAPKPAQLRPTWKSTSDPAGD
jgi:transposase-like protein/ribosomal protein L29